MAFSRLTSNERNRIALITVSPVRCVEDARLVCYLLLIAIPSLFSNDNNNNNNNSNDDKTIERRESKGFDRVSIRTRKRSGFFPAPIVLACSLFLPFVGGETRVRYARKTCWCSLLFRQSVKTAACQQQPPVLTSRPFRSLGHVRPLSTEEKML